MLSMTFILMESKNSGYTAKVNKKIIKDYEQST